ncbi:MAG: hypothetical protein HY791_28655 [Deltaproteobacteria bacterium]|nr:hypothetical protein [Deltaproteobacteria bacterium]
MHASPKIGVITNPNSKKNQGQRDRRATLQKIVGRLGIVRETQSVDEIAPVVEEFLSSGVKYWVTDGGDGSLHWLLNVAIERHGTSILEAVPAAVPANGGTIDFVARHAGLKGRAEDILTHLVAGLERHRSPDYVDVPSLMLIGERDTPGGEIHRVQKIGFAAAMAGIGNGFFKRYYEVGVKRGSRAIAKIIAKGGSSLLLSNTPVTRWAPRSWIEYGEGMRAIVEAEVRIDGQTLPYRRLTAFHVGAFPVNLGDVVKVFGKAENGVLHAMIGEVSDLEIVRNVPKIMLGRKVVGSCLYDGAARSIMATVERGERFRPVLDGEILEELDRFEIRPGPAIRIPKLDARQSPG